MLQCINGKVERPDDKTPEPQHLAPSSFITRTKSLHPSQTSIAQYQLPSLKTGPLSRKHHKTESKFKAVSPAQSPADLSFLKNQQQLSITTDLKRQQEEEERIKFYDKFLDHTPAERKEWLKKRCVANGPSIPKSSALPKVGVIQPLPGVSYLATSPTYYEMMA
jgi:hypothetical protein